MWIILEHKETKETKEYRTIQEAMNHLNLSRGGLRRRYVIHKKYGKDYWAKLEWVPHKKQDEYLIVED